MKAFTYYIYLEIDWRANVHVDFSWVVQNAKVLKKSYFFDLCFASDGKYKFLLQEEIASLLEWQWLLHRVDTWHQEYGNLQLREGLGSGKWDDEIRSFDITNLTPRIWKPSAWKRTGSKKEWRWYQEYGIPQNWGVGDGMMKILAVTRLTTRKWKPSASKGTSVYDLG